MKDPLFFANSLFLKKPERIMALLMIMGLALLVYSLAERKLREALKAMNATIPNQLRKLTQTPTIRWVFQMFQGLDILLFYQNRQVVFRKLVNLRPAQQQVITLLGPRGKNVTWWEFKVRNVGQSLKDAGLHSIYSPCSTTNRVGAAANRPLTPPDMRGPHPAVHQAQCSS